MARVAIVVVTYQSGEVVTGCLASIAGLPDVEIVVVDNASTDTTCKKVTDFDVRLIANANNAGFATGVNQGVRATTAPLVLLLNPDARYESGLESLVAAFENPGIAGAGGLLTGRDGLPQTGFMARNLPTPAALIFEVLGINRLWPGNAVNWNYRCLGKSPMESALIDQPAGAFFMFRRDAWESLGGFDEEFHPVWFEDVDFCARLRASGYFVRFQPKARAIHDGGHSVSTLSLELREKYWYGSLLKYAAKHFSSVALRIICLSVAVGAAGRGLRAFPRGGRKIFAVYSSVIRQSFACFIGERQSVRS